MAPPLSGFHRHWLDRCQAAVAALMLAGILRTDVPGQSSDHEDCGFT